MARKTLSQIVLQKPYPDFSVWWPMGEQFLAFMAEAICSQWQEIAGQAVPPITVQADVAEYIQLVYHRSARPSLATDFAEKRSLATMQSGEFDALSYAFYKSAFDTLATRISGSALQEERHAFTQRVGQIFYQLVHEHLALNLPHQLQTEADLLQLQRAIGQVGKFLQQQGYLRDHFDFHFQVNLHDGVYQVTQQNDDVIPRFNQHKRVYALYEMGYPVILPSAVYLYQTLGEAQHHSSRTIEELFGRIGYVASETSDFDPTGYPSDMVVELWEIYSR